MHERSPRVLVQERRAAAARSKLDHVLQFDPLVNGMLGQSALSRARLVQDAPLLAALLAVHNKPGHLLDLLLHHQLQVRALQLAPLLGRGGRALKMAVVRIGFLFAAS